MIVLQQSIGGVHLQMSAAGVRHVLGAPKSTKSVKDGETDPPTPIRVMDYGKTKISLSATEDGTVFNITTSDRRQKTSGGVGVGSSVAAIRRTIAGVRCDAHACIVGRELAGKRVTRFTLSKGHVRRITLGFVID